MSSNYPGEADIIFPILHMGKQPLTNTKIKSLKPCRLLMVPFQVCLTSSPMFFLWSHSASLPKPTSGPLPPNVFLGTQEIRKLRDTPLILFAVISQVLLVQTLRRTCPAHTSWLALSSPGAGGKLGVAVSSLLWSDLRDFEFHSMYQIQDIWKRVDKPEYPKPANEAPSLPNKE